MSETEFLYVVLIAAAILAPPTLAIIALIVAHRTREEVRQTQRALERLGEQLAELRLGLGAGPDAQARPAGEPTAETPDRPALHPSEPGPPEEQAAEEPAIPHPTSPEPLPEGPPEAAPPPPPRGSLEEILTERWLVWLGAVAIALAGAFLVKYAFEQGWLGPAVRVTLGFVMGVTLVVAGEWLRRRSSSAAATRALMALASLPADYVPPALAASGLSTAFASVYAAYALYGFLGPLTAFAGLAAVALAAVALSLLQGPFIALLGLAGAYLTPALVTTREPEPWSLFGYLLVILVACLALVRWQAWWWLGFAALAGAAFWPALWLLFGPAPEDLLPLGLYLLLAAVAFLAVRAEPTPLNGPPTDGPAASWPEALRLGDQAVALPWAGVFTMAVLLFALAKAGGHAPETLVIVGLFALACLFAGRREPLLDGLWPLAALLALLVLLAWPPPAGITTAGPLYTLEGETGIPDPVAPLVPPELAAFALAALGYGLLFAIGGFAVLWGAARPALWAGVSAATPLLALALAYWRVAGFRVDPGWLPIALALGAASLVAAQRCAIHRALPGLSAALGSYAAGVAASLGLGAAMLLEQAWLTVALAVQLPALAWIHERLAVRGFQVLAAVVAAVVLVRLVLNPYLVDYPSAATPLGSWVVYGYGLPALAFFWAARRFAAAEADSRLVTLLQAGALGFAGLLVSLEIRLHVAGALDAPGYSLLEQSLQTIAWLSIAMLLALRCRETPQTVALAGARILLALAVLQVVLGQLLACNPLWSHEPVGDWPLVNLLALAYLVPAAYLFRFASDLRLVLGPVPRWLPGALGFLLVFVWLSLEVRRGFVGGFLDTGAPGDGELYGYSLAWLVYAGALLGLGLLRGSAVLRHAGLVVLLVTVAKVFLVDMAGLTGLLRVLSFLGLGLALVAIGWLYRRVLGFGRG